MSGSVSSIGNVQPAFQYGLQPSFQARQTGNTAGSASTHARGGSGGGDTTTTTINPDGSTTTTVTGPDGVVLSTSITPAQASTATRLVDQTV